MRTWNIPGPLAVTSGTILQIITNDQMLAQEGAVSVTILCDVPFAITNDSGVDAQFSNCANQFPANVPNEINHRRGGIWIITGANGTVTASINSVP